MRPPEVGRVYAGKNGRNREVVGVQKHVLASRPVYMVRYRSIISPGQYATERCCRYDTWEAWVVGPAEELDA